MEILFLIGRIIFGGYFLIAGVNHFMKKEHMAGYAKSKGVKSAGPAVIFSGILLALGGLGVVLGIYPRIALILLIIFLIPTSFIMHAFWKEEGEGKQVDMQHFLKNMALIGASLALLTIELPWMLSL